MSKASSEQDKAEKQRKQAKRRQQAKRQRDAEKKSNIGIREYRIQLSNSEAAALDELRTFRGGYDVNEYLATLIRRDKERMEKEKTELGKCDFCGNALPSGCAKKFKGHGQCFFTRDEKKLRL